MKIKKWSFAINFKLVYYSKRVICTTVKGYIYTQNSPDSLCKNADYLKHNLYKLTAGMDIYYFLIGQGDYKLASRYNSYIDNQLDTILNYIKSILNSNTENENNI